jgi:Zn-dependent M28 family amino/carboxypeptidase
MNPTRTLVGEIRGRRAPDERVVLAAHVQEPGANDNASGVATLAELARALANGIRDGRIAPPARTITFLWLNEISGSRQWLQDHPEDAKRVKYMQSLDMTGEDVAKTGGSFLVERSPDPGAVWDRPWDAHSEWGSGNVRADRLKGDLLNDFHLAVCHRVAAKSGWVVKSNPYEGGSDHTVFGDAGVPSLLNWHFTDRYYHSSFDTPDKTSAAEMRNVGVAVAASAWLLANADEPLALAVADLVAAAGHARMGLETREGAKMAADAASAAREKTILDAWRKWYREAILSVERLAPIGEAARARLSQLAAAF